MHRWLDTSGAQNPENEDVFKYKKKTNQSGNKTSQDALSKDDIKGTAEVHVHYDIDGPVGDSGISRLLKDHAHDVVSHVHNELKRQWGSTLVACN